jgi:hypothetical protein
MITDNNSNTLNPNEVAKKSTLPDDRGNIQIDCYVRILDPKTQETLVEVRE